MVKLAVKKESNPCEDDKKVASKGVKLLLRVIFGILFFIVGFNFSRTTFFEEYPLFGVHSIGEILVSFVAGLFGFYYFPRFLLIAKNWTEELIMKAVSDIVSSFWEQQSRRIQEARREKQRSRAEKEAQKLQSEIANSILVDTSVLIDGRILDIAKTGFMDTPLLILEQVLQELQKVADSSDSLKRKRGRRGLDVARHLRRYTKVKVYDAKGKNKGVDGLLVEFAKQHKLRLLTVDYNLNKVAAVNGIRVLNINELTNALKTVLLPGETIRVKIIQEGKEKDQGVGYLSDGTMLVVEGAWDKVGEEVEAKVSKLIQKSAGKMIFCQLTKVE